MDSFTQHLDLLPDSDFLSPPYPVPSDEKSAKEYMDDLHRRLSAISHPVALVLRLTLVPEVIWNGGYKPM